jgi:DNA-binding Xre family transcriptional regulator
LEHIKINLLYRKLYGIIPVLKEDLLLEKMEISMRHISYKPLWHTLLDRDMKKEDLRIAAGLTTNMIANMGKNKGISMETLEKICDALKCEITDVIELTDELPKEGE